MKMRDRLLVFSCAQLLMSGALFAFLFWRFHADIIPSLEANLHEKTLRDTWVLARDLDVPLGAEDAELLTKALEPILADPDLHYVIVRDAKGTKLFERGQAEAHPFAGDPNVTMQGSRSVFAWSDVTLEGITLGSVSIGFDTSRIDEHATNATRLAFGVALVWLAACGYSLFFARSFIAPIKAMMKFSRRVADGTLTEPLVVAAPGELEDLRDDLNAMTLELARRETERERAATERERLQHEMIAISRTAGMAEVATSVLHNVGNVLNSVNVSVTLMAEMLEGATHSALAQVLEMADRAGGLPALLQGPKGALVEEYLRSLAKQSEQTNVRMTEEVAALLTNVDHVKHIIAAQQAHARTSGVREPVELCELIDDALRIGDLEAKHYGIEVRKDFAVNPTVETDRHKLLQVLVNVFSNARHALAETADRVVVIEVSESDDRVSIAVADNGVGIPPENLNQLFRHGFTTKKHGHGFGLHASALAIQELGGEISVVSSGVGKGAAFTIAIPHQPSKRPSYEIPN